MNLDLAPDDLAFVEDVRGFLARDFPQDLMAKVRAGGVLSRDDHVRSQQALQSRGWLAAGWPTEHGGPGWSPLRRFLFEKEIEAAGVPEITPMALIYIGPIIAAFGTPEQQVRWLPEILSSREMWAQGYSEPDAGSDLACLSFKAERDGEDYVLNGSKIWTTRAHWADWIFCLARTSQEERRQDGISMICAPMNAPGITVRPIHSIDGTHELNQVFFDNVRTPIANRIGEEGRAWHYANELLAKERLSYAHIGRKRAEMAAIRATAGRLPGDNQRSMQDEPAFARRLGRAEIRIDNLELATLRALTGAASRAAISMLKVASTELAQELDELAVELCGRQALAFPDRTLKDWTAPLHPFTGFGAGRMGAYLFNRAQTIYGGTSEIQKTIVWKELSRFGREGA